MLQIGDGDQVQNLIAGDILLFNPYRVIRGDSAINIDFDFVRTSITLIVWRIFGDKIGIKLVCWHCAFHNRVIPQGIKQD